MKIFKKISYEYQNVISNKRAHSDFLWVLAYYLLEISILLILSNEKCVMARE